MICTTGLPNSCTVCSPLYYLLLAQTTCFETCPDFYYNFQKNFTCQACSSNCQKCLNGTYCSSCQRGYLLFNATCLSTCPGGTYANADSTVCLDCPKGCYNCSGNSQCFSCFSKYYFNPGLGFCFSCNDVCLNCTGPGQTECTACSSPMVLMKGTCSVLSCGLGTYVDPISGCVECGKKYPGATLCNITQPLSCSSQYIFSSNQCVQCKDARGYQVLSDNTCGEICGDGILIYLQCDDGNTLNGDGCSSKCTIEPGWNCSSSPSKCQLISPLQLRVLQATKKPGVNSISLLLEMSLPIRVTVSSFSISMTGLGSDRFTYSIAQQESNLSVVAIEMNYRDSLQGRKLEISYSSASSSGRRLL
jgi:cysteine-rich repeat protein